GAIDLLILSDQVAAGSECVSHVDSLRPLKALSRNRGLRSWSRSRQQWCAEWRTRTQIGANQHGESNCSVDVNLTGTLLERIKAGERLRGVHQDCLDQIRRQIGIDL